MYLSWIVRDDLENDSFIRRALADYRRNRTRHSGVWYSKWDLINTVYICGTPSQWKID